jgi:hypothetical protein
LIHENKLLFQHSVKQFYAQNFIDLITMVDLKADLDQYLLLNSEKKKTTNFKIDMKMPKAPDVVTRWFGQSEPVEANSWLKDAEDTCCPKLVSWFKQYTSV